MGKRKRDNAEQRLRSQAKRRVVAPQDTHSAELPSLPLPCEPLQSAENATSISPDDLTSSLPPEVQGQRSRDQEKSHADPSASIGKDSSSENAVENGNNNKSEEAIDNVQPIATVNRCEGADSSSSSIGHRTRARRRHGKVAEISSSSSSSSSSLAMSNTSTPSLVADSTSSEDSNRLWASRPGVRTPQDESPADGDSPADGTMEANGGESGSQEGQEQGQEGDALAIRETLSKSYAPELPLRASTDSMQQPHLNLHSHSDSFPSRSALALPMLIATAPDGVVTDNLVASHLEELDIGNEEGSALLAEAQGGGRQYDENGSSKDDTRASDAPTEESNKAPATTKAKRKSKAKGTSKPGEIADGTKSDATKDPTTTKTKTKKEKKAKGKGKHKKPAPSASEESHTSPETSSDLVTDDSGDIPPTDPLEPVTYIPFQIVTSSPSKAGEKDDPTALFWQEWEITGFDCDREDPDDVHGMEGVGWMPPPKKAAKLRKFREKQIEAWKKREQENERQKRRDERQRMRAERASAQEAAEAAREAGMAETGEMNGHSAEEEKRLRKSVKFNF